MKHINRNGNILIIGQTGSGKSTGPVSRFKESSLKKNIPGLEPVSGHGKTATEKNFNRK